VAFDSAKSSSVFLAAPNFLSPRASAPLALGHLMPFLVHHSLFSPLCTQVSFETFLRLVGIPRVITFFCPVCLLLPHVASWVAFRPASPAPSRFLDEFLICSAIRRPCDLLLVDFTASPLEPPPPGFGSIGVHGGRPTCEKNHPAIFCIFFVVHFHVALYHP